MLLIRIKFILSYLILYLQISLELKALLYEEINIKDKSCQPSVPGECNVSIRVSSFNVSHEKFNNKLI